MSGRGWRRGALVVASALALLLTLGTIGLVRDLRAPALDGPPPPPADAALRERGAYLARVGNCAGCHTAPGGTAYAGGRAIATPFGNVYASNLTPDPATGLGRWSADAFWRAMHEGRSRDGRLLSPAFPYVNTTHVRREDSDAIYAWLRSLPPVVQGNRPAELRFPFNQPLALAAWRRLYFRPATSEGEATADAGRSAAWQRGAYLVRGLGHCSACHAERDALGGSAGALSLGGGWMPSGGWYAPSLTDPREGGLGAWPVDDIQRLLTVGTTLRGSVLGPMAEVVHGSTQYLTPEDAQAMAEFLKSWAAEAPPRRPRGGGPSEPMDSPRRAEGERLYGTHCADCHGRSGEGVPGAYPALAGNRAITMTPAANLVQVIVHGGFAPATAGNPRPYGMPPFGLTLGDEELAALISFLRSAWGHQAPALSAREVQALREGDVRTRLP